MRIIVSGASGIGKTTLCRDLAARLSIPYLEEDYHDIIISRNALLRLLESKDSSQDSLKKAYAHYEMACVNWIKRRIEWRRNHDSYVADRCTADLLHTWISSSFSIDTSRTLNLLTQACADEIRHINLAVVPPLMQLSKSEPRNESQLARGNKIENRLKAHASIIGLLHIFQAGDKLLMLKTTPGKQDSREQRVMDVLHWAEQSGHSLIPNGDQELRQPQ